MSATHRLRVFLSSPGDVADERGLARRVIARLNRDPTTGARVQLEEVSWDDPNASVPLAAHLTPQEAINLRLPEPSQCDIVVVILWCRIGTPLPSEHRKADGASYVSGTEWEYLDAIDAAERNAGRPVVLVYRSMKTPPGNVDDADIDERIRQYRAVQSFFAGFKESGTGSPSLRSHKKYQGPSEFKALLEDDLRALIAEQLRQSPPSPPTPRSMDPDPRRDARPHSPYRGLHRFRAEDESIFFGRGRETDDLVSLLGSPRGRVLAVLGPSGSGKSSLVAAGLIPRLADGALPGSADWDLVRFTPAQGGDDPFYSLALWLGPRTGVKPIELAERLREHPETIEETADRMLAGRPAGAELVLFVDQFEELFAPRVAAGHRRAFVDLIDAIAGSRRVRLLLTLRADFFEHCTRFETLAERLNAGGYALPAPGIRALAEMVERPAQAFGLRMEAGLADRILEDTGTEPGALALMEFTLERLYDARSGDVLTNAAYDALGGVAGAVEIQSERAVRDERGRLDEAALERLFRLLAAVDETGGAVRKRAPLAGLSEAQRALADRLIAARLLTSDRDGDGAAMVEVAHEAVLRHWKRLTTWLDVNRRLLLWRQRLELLREGGDLLTGTQLSQARDWLRQSPRLLEREEVAYIQRSIEAARRRSVRAWVSFLFLLSLSGAGFGLWQYENAKAAAQWRERTRPIYEEADWVEIPAGEFRMGSDDQDSEAFDDEKPPHPVKITRPFRLSRHEVTIEEYNRFALATGREPAYSAGFGAGLEPRARARLPAIYVSWDDAVAYAGWLSKGTGRGIRLPTEAEWEYAARAGAKTRRFWGDDLEKGDACGYANVQDQALAGSTSYSEAVKQMLAGQGLWAPFSCDDGYANTAPVGAFTANPRGLHDMLGNVYEWVQDCWHGSYDDAPEDGSRPWLGENGGDCGRRVVRGGSWYGPPGGVRSANRDRGTTDERNGDVGFRLAQDVE